MAGVGVDVIDVVHSACLAGADAAVRAGGWVPEPQVHMLIDDWDPPYVGFVVTRPYRDGVDAVRAITRLAAAPAAIMATRVVLVWEEADLRASLFGAGDYPNAIVIVEADLHDRHRMRWHPFVTHIDATSADTVAVRPEWGTPVTLENAPLPPVMMSVLDSWRALEGDPGTVFAELIGEGYRPTIFER